MQEVEKLKFFRMRRKPLKTGSKSVSRNMRRKGPPHRLSGGPVLIEIHGTEVGIGHGMAEKIEVEVVEEE